MADRLDMSDQVLRSITRSAKRKQINSKKEEKYQKDRIIPSLFSGVYTEFTGEKELPRAIRERRLIFLFGPSGVGKTMVAEHLMGEERILYKQQQVLEAFLEKIRKGRWHNKILNSEGLILETPCFLEQRPQILQMLENLLQLRSKRGLRTVVLDAEDFSPVRGLLQAVSPEERAMILLRFPSGRGKYRFLAHECRKRQVSIKLARHLAKIKPWNYSRVFGLLEDVVEGRVSEEALLQSLKGC